MGSEMCIRDSPEAHRELAKSTSKSRDYAIIGNLLQERSQQSPVPLTMANAPLATTKLIDDVFRTFRPSGGNGLKFGSHLSPFAIVCEGHAEATAPLELIKTAEVAESSTTVSLDDAKKITTSDVRFPPNAYFAGEKLYGWSVVVDVFHGHLTPVAVAVRNFVINVVPHLHQVHYQSSDEPLVGLDLICCVLYEAQQ